MGMTESHRQIRTWSICWTGFQRCLNAMKHYVFSELCKYLSVILPSLQMNLLIIPEILLQAKFLPSTKFRLFLDLGISSSLNIQCINKSLNRCGAVSHCSEGQISIGVGVKSGDEEDYWGRLFLKLRKLIEHSCLLVQCGHCLLTSKKQSKLLGFLFISEYNFRNQTL